MRAGTPSTRGWRSISAWRISATRDGCIHLDADIVLPDRLRTVLEKSRLDKRCVYGADRVNVRGYAEWERVKSDPAYARQFHHRYLINVPDGLPLGARLLHDEFGYCPIGFFQLWHSSARRRYPVNQGSAEHTDVFFSCQWPAANRRLLPTVICYHLESENARWGANWNGRTTDGFEGKERTWQIGNTSQGGTPSSSYFSWSASQPGEPAGCRVGDDHRQFADASVNQGLGIFQFIRDPIKMQRAEDLERISGESKLRKQDSDKRIGAIEKSVDDSRRAGFATKAQLRELKEDVHNRLKEMSAYLHDTHHGITGEIRALYAAGEQRGKEVHEAAILLNTQNEERAVKLHETISSVRLRAGGRSAVAKNPRGHDRGGDAAENYRTVEVHGAPQGKLRSKKEELRKATHDPY